MHLCSYTFIIISTGINGGDSYFLLIHLKNQAQCYVFFLPFLLGKIPVPSSVQNAPCVVPFLSIYLQRE